MHAPTAPASQRTRTTPQSAGLPDPRPVTEYTVTYSEPGANSRLTIELDQPCIIRAPAWSVIDSEDGSQIPPATVSVESNTKIHLDFNGLIPKTAGFVEIPYQDMQVQNFQGGFVRPGARWFRKAS